MINKIKSRNYSLKVSEKKMITYKNQKNNIKTLKSVNNNKNKNKIKPPFNPGILSYNISLKPMNKKKQNYSRNIKKNNINFFSSNIYSVNPNLTKRSSNEKNNNYFNNNCFSSRNKKITTKNILLSQSSINLNKYKINNNNIHSNIRSVDNIESKNINKFINNNINLNINFNYKKNIPKKENNIKLVPHFNNYFSLSSKYEKESRRMLLEYIKILNKKEKDIKNVLQKYNISQKVLNQKVSTNDIKQINSNDINQTKNKSNGILLGENKKESFLNNLDYSLSKSDTNSDREEDYEPHSNIKSINKKIFSKKSLDKFSINLPKSRSNQKIKIINFLFVPKILNLIESNNKSEKYIFILVSDESTYINGIENYKIILKDINNVEIKKEININDIKRCYINDKYQNRFIIKAVNNLNELNIEIETPTKQICEYIVNGIKYISKNRKINE